MRHSQRSRADSTTKLCNWRGASITRTGPETMTDFSLPCTATGKLSKTTVFLNLFVLPLFPKLSLNSVLGVTLEWQGPEPLSAHSRVGDEAFPGKGPGPLTGPKQNWAASVAGLTLSRSFRSKPAWDSAVSWTPPHSRFFPPLPQCFGVITSQNGVFAWREHGCRALSGVPTVASSLLQSHRH